MGTSTQPAPSGALQVKVLRQITQIGDLVRDDERGHYRRHRAKLLLHNRKQSMWRQQILAWLRDHVWREIPRKYYELVLGHDLHISVWAELYTRHYHANEPDPFTGQLGWWENVGLVARGKVTTAFRDFEIDNLITATTEYGDFKYHRVGTSNQAESNADTALIADAGITGVAGSQSEGGASYIYKTVATITADATETWYEHGIFSQAGSSTPAGTLMDRSVLSTGQSVTPGDKVEFTYQLTKYAEV